MLFAAVLLVAAVLGKHHEKRHVFVDIEEIDYKLMYEGWKAEFNQHFSKLEDMERFKVFSENVRRIYEHNARNDTTYQLGINQFAAMTNPEFKAKMTGCVHQKPRTRQTFNKHHSGDVFVPSSVDWTAKGKVTPVKNQEQCGSCWAFSTTGSIESRSAIAGKPLVSLSEQQLVDCSRAFGNQGCQGGLMDSAFRYVEQSGGLCTEAEYPYTAKNGQCKAASCGTKYDPVGSYTDVQKDDEEALKAAVAAGPVSIAIEADQFSFQFYHSGVLKGTCGSRLDHGVLAVGYGTDSSSGLDYWKVKNSWGGTWGMHGYVLICRNCHKDAGKGECGILSDPSFPVPK